MARSLPETSKAEVVDKDVGQLLEDEGGNLDDIIAEQKLILNDLAKRDDEPPWMSSASGSKDSLFGSGDKVYRLA